jgi:hypothetical protein
MPTSALAATQERTRTAHAQHVSIERPHSRTRPLLDGTGLAVLGSAQLVWLGVLAYLLVRFAF